jgi:hypothetical protein
MGNLHRTDGPSIDYATPGSPKRYQEWWLDGVEYDAIEWMIKVYELENS